MNLLNHRYGGRISARWLIAGLLLLVYAVILVVLSARFDAVIPLANRPVLTFTALLFGAGLIYLFFSELLRHEHSGRSLLGYIIVLGLLMRLGMFFSTPILEDDYHRYLWDGAVSAAGTNPYQFSPDEVKAALQGQNGEVPAEIVDLGKAGQSTLEQINHSYLRSIYPPQAQLFFALAHRISPWDINGWRMVLFGVDLAVLALLLALLNHLGRPPAWIAIYWINPLLIREVFNSGHMEVLIFPFLLGATWLFLRKCPISAMVLLGLASAVKLWPILLAPLFLRNIASAKKRLQGAVWFVVIIAIAMLPQLLAGLDTHSGLQAYAQRWELNDSLFRLGVWINAALLSLLGVHPGYSQLVTRLLSAVFVIGWMAYWSWKPSDNSEQLIQRMVIIITALFLVSPTQFPWYSLWILPFLALWPSRALLLLTVFMSLYYLRFHFEALGQTAIFDHYLVWLEYLPVWAAIWIEWQRARRKNSLFNPKVMFTHEK